LPDDVLAALRYELVLTGPRGELLERTVTGGESFSLAVSLGEWRIDAKAYQDTALAGTGSVTLAVGPGSNSAQVPMNMTGPCYEIRVDSDTVHGTVRSNFTAAFAGTSITITAEKDAGAVFVDNSLKAEESGTFNPVVNGLGMAHTFMMPASDVEVTARFLRLMRYVREGGAGTKDGTSWENASGDLQEMMDEHWLQFTDYPTYTYVVKVGAGTYKPQYKPNTDYTTDYTTSANDRDSAFLLREGVQVWGGYPAGGGEDGSRNVTANKTVLSGDLNNSTTVDTGDAYHVVLGVNIPAAGGTVLDGLTIRGGSADGSGNIGSESIGRNSGGGMYNYNSSPEMTNVTICNNAAGSGSSGRGVGMYNDNSSPVLIDATISENKTTTINSSGGGIYNDNGSSPVLIDVTITKNEATGSNNRGGGMRNNNSSPVLINVTISGNTAIPTSSAGGGGMYNGNGSSPVLINVRISGNKVTSDGTYGNNGGGGIYNYNSSPKLINVTISGNMATRINGGDSVGGGGMFNTGSSSPVIRNSIIWGNAAPTDPGISGSSGSIEYSMVEGSMAPVGTGNAGLETGAAYSPFIDWKDPGSAPTTEGDYRLNNTGNANDAKDAGNNSDYPTDVTHSAFSGFTFTPTAQAAINAALALGKDLGGNTRIQGSNIDMGAYER
jgi:hypothetical protein